MTRLRRPAAGLQARRERRDLVAQVEPNVRRLFEELTAADRVVEAVKADAALSGHGREVALQVVLATALGARSSAPAPPGSGSVGTDAASPPAGAASPPPT